MQRLRSAIRRWQAVPLSCVLATVLVSVSASPSRGDEPARLTAEQRKQLRQMIAEFRRSRDDLDRRDDVAQQILRLGPPAARELLGIVDKELESRTEAYRARFGKQATARLRKQTAGTDLSDLTVLQNQVLRLLKVDSLSKEMIDTEADPAVKALRELLLLDPMAVMAESETLKAERERLLRLGRVRDECARAAEGEAAGDREDDDAKAGENAADPGTYESYVEDVEQEAVESSLIMPRQVRAVFAANSRLAPRIDRQEARAIRSINVTRYLVGLEPLAIDPQLCAAARDHSRDMARLKFFSHMSPVEGKRSATERAANFGTTVSAENIHVGTDDGPTAVDSWFHSPGHFKNMLGDHRRVGAGRDRKYFTALFGR